MPDRPARPIAFVERHATYWPDAAAAAAELVRVIGEDAVVFLLVDADGEWQAACATAPEGFHASRWVETRVLPAGRYGVGLIDEWPTEHLEERADGRPPGLIRAEEAPTGEAEYEPGGETFGLTTLLGQHAGMTRIGVNIDLVRPGERATRFHWHHEEEECFLVLSGSGILQIGERSHRIGPGDFFAKPPGPGSPHQFVNDGTRDLRILTVGERLADEVEYPPSPWSPGDPLPEGLT